MRRGPGHRALAELPLRHPAQVFSVILPPPANVRSTITKAVAATVLIAAPEVTLRVQLLTTRFFRPLEIYTGAALLYIGLICAHIAFMRGLERLRKWQPT